ncbi:LysR substrate-binding domain-containing protein [Puniceibacterium sediminis]|uniref:LysR family transcriptional regulator, hydrogen peroxide-inducible genes activator n=1 Tax=Puniceibacterium sediminis TaxID=1608407 RepID=A0A238XIR7_9RHOB|nr:LysR substrate-binding domain-containing protein [Puniceibacterium sediminis]SNR58600.1 LysR family transcriptional regulator, hydrogen peroxide-inducible genes activator [Puniceibacterium sediminis]
MNTLTLKQLRYFEALARHLHFGHAAEASAISQPALSVQIRELETSLGVALFERGPRQVRLTPFGTEFAVRAREILRKVDELGDLARLSQGGLSGRLRVGVIPTIAPYLVPTVIRSLTRTWPELDIHIRETTTPRLIQELEEGALDAAIVALPVSEPTLTEVELFTESFVLVRHRDEADRPMPDRDRLREMRLLLLEEGHCFRDQALSFCDRAGGRAKYGLDASSLSTLVQMVGAGIGVTLLPEMAVAVETRSAPVVIGRFADPQPSRTVGMIWRKSTPLADQLFELAAGLANSLRDDSTISASSDASATT